MRCRKYLKTINISGFVVVSPKETVVCVHECHSIPSFQLLLTFATPVQLLAQFTQWYHSLKNVERLLLLSYIAIFCNKSSSSCSFSHFQWNENVCSQHLEFCLSDTHQCQISLFSTKTQLCACLTSHCNIHVSKRGQRLHKSWWYRLNLTHMLLCVVKSPVSFASPEVWVGDWLVGSSCLYVLGWVTTTLLHPDANWQQVHTWVKRLLKLELLHALVYCYVCKVKCDFLLLAKLFLHKKIWYMLKSDLGRWIAIDSVGVISGVNLKVGRTQLHDAGLQGIPPSSPSVPNYTVICFCTVVTTGVISAIKICWVTPRERERGRKWVNVTAPFLQKWMVVFILLSTHQTVLVEPPASFVF